MTLKTLKYYLLFLVLFSVLNFSYGQTPQDAYLNSQIEKRSIDKSSWERAKEGIIYSEKEKKKEEDYDEELTPLPSQSSGGSTVRSYPSGGSSPFWAGFFKVLFIILIIAAIALLVVHFMGAGSFTSPSNRKIIRSDAKITIDNIEEHIYESDLDRFIREAVEQQNYALAIRLYYLAIIKELSLNRTIHWKKDKTNKDYLREMRKTNMFQSFRETTRIFERIWYGEGDFKEADYLDVKPKFEALVKAAQSKQVIISPE